MNILSYDQLALAARHALEANDCLGFDTVGEALRAVLSHDDWAQRWEVLDPIDRQTLRDWKRARLDGRRV